MLPNDKSSLYLELFSQFILFCAFFNNKSLLILSQVSSWKQKDEMKVKNKGKIYLGSPLLLRIANRPCNNIEKVAKSFSIMGLLHHTWCQEYIKFVEENVLTLYRNICRENYRTYVMYLFLEVFTWKGKPINKYKLL